MKSPFLLVKPAVLVPFHGRFKVCQNSQVAVCVDFIFSSRFRRSSSKSSSWSQMTGGFFLGNFHDQWYDINIY
jgi:hypothetical protein